MSSVKNGTIEIQRTFDDDGNPVTSNLVIKAESEITTIALPHYIKVYFSQLHPILNEPYSLLNETDIALCQMWTEPVKKEEADE